MKITSSYTYDGDNLRQTKTVNGVQTQHILDGADVIADISGESVKTFVRGTELEFLKTPDGATQGYMTSYPRGDVHYLTSQDGTVNDYTYTAYGEKVGTNDNSVNPFGYCGEYYDTETDLVYLRNRYYDPEMHRFTTEDPAKDGLNWYAYCNGNPVMFTDSWGLETKEDLKYGENSKVYIALVILGDAWDAFPDYRDDIGEVANEIRWIANTRGVKKIENNINGILKVVKNLSTVEQVIAAGYPTDALSINNARKKADRETINIFNQYGNGTDDANAFKHAYWNALAASEIGSKMTKIFTDAHEFGWASENINDVDAMIMDLKNNEIGRNIGSNYNPNHHTYTLKQSVMNYLMEGKLWKKENGKLIPTNLNAEFKNG